MESVELGGEGYFGRVELPVESIATEVCDVCRLEARFVGKIDRIRLPAASDLPALPGTIPFETVPMSISSTVRRGSLSP